MRCPTYVGKQEAEVLAQVRDSSPLCGCPVTAVEITEVGTRRLSTIKHNVKEMRECGYLELVDRLGSAPQHPRVARYLLTQCGLDQLNEYIAEKGDPCYDD